MKTNHIIKYIEIYRYNHNKYRYLQKYVRYGIEYIKKYIFKGKFYHI